MAEQTPINRAHFTLKEVLRATNGEIEGEIAGGVSGVSANTRTLQPGDLFVALRGEKFDGHNYLEQARQAGAVVAIVAHDAVLPPKETMGQESHPSETIVAPASDAPETKIEDIDWDDDPDKALDQLVEVLEPLVNEIERVTVEHESGQLASLLERSQVEAGSLNDGRMTYIKVPDTLKALGDLARAHRQRFEIPVVGVTGSYGKTTTRAFIAAALSAQGEVLSSQGNFNNEIGVPMTLLGLQETHSCAVVEMAMRGEGQIAYLADIARPTVGVITNIGPQHVEILGSIENIARAKSEMLRFLSEEDVAVLPADDPYIDFFTDQVGCRTLTFGRNPSADYHVGDVKIESDGGISFSVTPSSDLHTLHVRLPIPGEHNALNAACALAVADALGVPLADAARALERVEVPGARMRIIKAHGLTIIDDCYNAGPTSMRAALQTLRDWPQAARRVAILGAMRELGATSEREHQLIGAMASGFVDALICVGEETRALMEAASGVEVQWCEDASGAAELARELGREGDVILVKGSRSVGLEVVVSALAE